MSLSLMILSLIFPEVPSCKLLYTIPYEVVSKVVPHRLFGAPTGKSVGSNFCNLLGTNGFTRWSKNNK